MYSTIAIDDPRGWVAREHIHKWRLILRVNGRKVNHFIKWGKCVLIEVFLENKMIKRLEKLRNWAMTSFMDVPCEKTQLLFYEIFFTFELNESVSYNEQWSGLIRPTWWGSNESLPQICCCSATYHILLAYIIIMCIPNFALQCPPGVCPISVISPLSCWIPYPLVTSLLNL